MSTGTPKLNQSGPGTLASGDSPFLLPVISPDAATAEVVGCIAERLLCLVAQRYPVTVAPGVAPEQIEVGLENWLHQSGQLLLLAFGPAATAALQALTGTLPAKLAQVAGEVVHNRVLPLPSAMPDRPVFAPLEGLGCPQGQLAPLVSQFPGWLGTYLCLEAGSRQIILICGQTGRREGGNTTSASLIIGSLAAALIEQEGRLKRDGEILASYLRSLVGAVLRQTFHSESTTSAVPSSLLLPPWYAGARN